MLPKPNMQSQLQKKTERFSNKKKTVQSCPLNHGKLLIFSVDTHIQMFYTTLCCAVVNRHNNTFTLEETKTNKTGFTTKSITMMALFAAILCISAYISIPLPIPGSPHITLLNFVIIVIALLFPLSQSFITILVWMALGAIGLPVFIGGGSGLGYLTNNFGG